MRDMSVRISVAVALILLLLIVPININATPASADQTLAQELIDQYLTARDSLINLYNLVLLTTTNKTVPSLQARLKVVNGSITAADKLITEAQDSYQDGDYLKAKTLALVAINKLTPAYHILNRILKELDLINSTALGVYYKTLEIAGFYEREKFLLKKVNQSVIVAKMHGVNVTNITKNLTRLWMRLNNVSLTLNKTLAMIKNITHMMIKNMTHGGAIHSMTKKLTIMKNRIKNMTLHVSMNKFIYVVKTTNKKMLKVMNELRLELNVVMSRIGKYMGWMMAFNRTSGSSKGVGLGPHHPGKDHGAPTNTTSTASHRGERKGHKKGGKP